MRSKFKGVALVAAIVISKYLLLEVWEYRTFCHELSRNQLDGIIIKVFSKTYLTFSSEFYFDDHNFSIKIFFLISYNLHIMAHF